MTEHQGLATDDSMYRLLVQSIGEYAIYMLTLDGTVNSWNAGAQRAKGYSVEEALGRHFSTFYTPGDRARGLPEQAMQQALASGRFEGEGWRQRRDGSCFWAHVTLEPVMDESGKVIGLANIARDLTEQKEREQKASDQEQSFRLLVQGVTDYAIYMLSPGGVVTNWNAGAERVKGYRAEEIVGRHFSHFYRPEDRRRGLPQRALDRAASTGKFEGEGWRLRKDGTQFWAHVVIDAIRGEDGQLIGFAKITRDVTEKKKIEDQVSHLAHHDVLTSLLNRASFQEAVTRALAEGRHCVLLYLDLDRFKPVNDSLGHRAGDKVLHVVGDRITGQLRKTDVGGRLGGDEFAVLLVDCPGAEAAEAAGERLIRRIEEPIVLDASSVSVGVSVGMAIAGGVAQTAEALIRQADLALYAAKKDGRGLIRWYDPGMEAAMQQVSALERDLRVADARGELLLHYQPIVDASSRKVAGYEALVRWQCPTRGLVSPAEFIPFAEEHGLMEQIGLWVLRAACTAAARWPGTLSVSINVSPAQFRAPGLVQQITAVLDETGLAAERLELEITETVMMGDLNAAKVTLDALRAHGIMVAMDDFGTGYSSLSFLRMLPFTRIKIDKSFIQDLGTTRESLAIIRAVIGLCSSLGMATTAEGVETEEQLRILQREGCKEVQGYMLGRPAPTIEGDRLQHNPVSRESHRPGAGSPAHEAFAEGYARAIQQPRQYAVEAKMG